MDRTDTRTTDMGQPTTSQIAYATDLINGCVADALRLARRDPQWAEHEAQWHQVATTLRQRGAARLSSKDGASALIAELQGLSETQGALVLAGGKDGWAAIVRGAGLA